MRSPLCLNHPVLGSNPSRLISLLKSAHGVGVVLAHAVVDLVGLPVSKLSYLSHPAAPAHPAGLVGKSTSAPAVVRVSTGQVLLLLLLLLLSLLLKLSQIGKVELMVVVQLLLALNVLGLGVVGGGAKGRDLHQISSRLH